MYSKIDSRFWDDEKVLELSVNASYLMLYLLTSKHRNILGCYPLPKPYAQSDTKLNTEDFESAWDELIDIGLIEYDEKCRIVLVRNFLKFNAIENPNQAKGALSKLEEMPRTRLFAELITVLQRLDKAFLKPLIEGLRERLPKGFSEPDNSNSKQITEQKKKNAHAREDCEERKSVREQVRPMYTEQTTAFGEDLPKVVPFDYPERIPEDIPLELRDPDFAELQRIYQDRVKKGAKLSNGTLQDLSELCNNVLPAAVLVELVKFADRSETIGSVNFRYVQSIAKDWQKLGIDTPEKARLHIENLETKKANKAANTARRPDSASAIADSLMSLYIDEEVGS